MYGKKKQAKIMINGWRADAINAGRLQMLLIGESEKFGESFIKAEFMDHLLDLGMDAYEKDVANIAAAERA
jgi:hypothetical protein